MGRPPKRWQKEWHCAYFNLPPPPLPKKVTNHNNQWVPPSLRKEKSFSRRDPTVILICCNISQISDNITAHAEVLCGPVLCPALLQLTMSPHGGVILATPGRPGRFWFFNLINFFSNSILSKNSLINFFWFHLFKKLTNQLFFYSIFPQKLPINYFFGLIFLKNLLMNLLLFQKTSIYWLSV